MVYPISKIILWSPLSKFIKGVDGLENLPPDKPFIIAANHESYLDPFLIGVTIIRTLDKKVHFLSKKGRFWNVFGDRISRDWAGCVPLDEGKEKALQTMVDLLKDGEIVAFFPSGPRTLDGNMTRGKTGAVRTALKSMVPIIPFGITGTFELAPRENLIPKFKRNAAIKIGKPIYLNKYYNKKITKNTLRKLTNEMMVKISKLISKKYYQKDFDIKKLLIIIPCYDTQNQLGGLLEKLKAHNRDILIVDDGSKDQTYKTAKKAGIRVIRHKENRGKGAALKTGFRYAIENKYEAVLVIDGDGQHDPEEIPAFLRNARGMDVIVGDRVHDPRPMPFRRKCANRISSFIVSLICRQKISDAQCGYRLIKTHVLKNLNLVLNGYQLDTELLIKAARKGYTIGEVPIKTLYANEVSHIRPVNIFFQFFRAISLR